MLVLKVEKEPKKELSITEPDINVTCFWCSNIFR